MRPHLQNLDLNASHVPVSLSRTRPKQAMCAGGGVEAAVHNTYPREAEMGPVGPQGVNGGSQDHGMAQQYEQRQGDNRAGFFQSSPA